MIRLDPALPLVCVPGWGFAPPLWAGICAQLQDVLAERSVQVVDLWGAAEPILPPRFIGVGHSLGALWLLRQQAPALAGCVVISGFRHFPVAPRVLARMQTQFARDPETVLATFQARCQLGGGPAAASATNADPSIIIKVNDHSFKKLQQGLAWLAAWEAPAPSCPLLALHGGGDVIVGAAEAARQLPGLVICPDAPHALPLTHPAWCAARIREWCGV